MSGNWLDSYNTSNSFRQTYTQGFIDVSGGNVLLRNNNLLLQSGDVSSNGRLFITNDISANSRFFTGGDVSLNGRLFVENDTLLNGRLYINPNSLFVGGILTNTISSNTATSDINNNTRLGTNTLQNTTAGTNNIAIGYNSGTTNITGTNNTFLGANTNVSTPAITQSTAVGYNAQITGNNQIVFGTSTEKTIFMGDTTMNSRLFVGGDASFGGNITLNGNLTVGSLVGTGATVTGLGTGGISSTTSNILSTNTATYGQTWGILSGTPTSAAYQKVALSSTGQYIIATTNTSSINISSNYGQSFKSIHVGLTSSIKYTNVSISSTGQYITLCSSNNFIYSSSDYGLSFSAVTNTQNVIIIAVGVATATTGHSIAYSHNPSVWTGITGTTIFTAGYGVAWSFTLAMFVAVGTGTNTIAYSFDGINWTGLGKTIFTTQGNSIFWSGTMWMAGGQGTNTIASSVDGRNWIGYAPSNFTSVNGIAWSGTTWVAVGAGTNSIAYSLDGLTWTGVTGKTMFSVQGNGVTWGTMRPYGPFFSAVGQGTTYYAYSRDGITWTAPANTYMTTGYGVYSNDISRSADQLFAVGAGTTYNVGSGRGDSGPGGTFKPFATAAYSIIYVESIRSFVAVGTGAHSIMYGSFFNTMTGFTGTTIFSSGRGVTYGLLPLNYSGVALSSTGQYQVTTMDRGSIFLAGSIYVSSDYGTTFIPPINGAPGSEAYKSISVSSNGQYMLSCTNPGAVYLSANYGSTFTKVSTLSTTAAFTSTAISSTGQYMMTCVNGGFTFISSNYGETFIANPVVNTSSAYQSTSISSTGQYQLVTARGGSIFISTNYGQTFTINSTGAPSSANYQTAAISSTGKYMIAAANTGALYISSPPLVSTTTTNLTGLVTMTDLSMSGNLYTPTIITSQVEQSNTEPIYNTNSPELLAGSTTSPGNNCQGLAVSQNGQYIISCAVVGAGGITYSTDFGKTFTLLTTSSGKFCQGAAISATGQYMIVTTQGVGTFYTKNFGSTWLTSITTLSASLNASCTTISSTGQYVIYGTSTGIYLSNNFGNTFTNTGTVSRGSWNGCAISSNGQYMCVVGGALYLSNNYGSTWILSRVLPTNVGALDGIRMSSSGQYIIVTNQTPNAAFPVVCISSDFGSSWTNGGFNSTIANIYGVSISSTGKYMALNINVTTNNLYFSDNYGTSFRLSTYSSGLSFVRSSFSNIGFYAQNASNGRVYISKATISQRVNSTPFMNIIGYVGVNDVSGSATGSDAKALVEINGVGNLSQTYSTTDTYSLYTSGSVLIGQNLNIASDRRIKTNIHDVVDVSALSVLRQLNPKRYNYIDTANRGTQPVWGYIAQDVKSIMDYAVDTVTDYIPNIYYNITVNENSLTLPRNTYMVTPYDEDGNPLPETEYTDPAIPTMDNFTPNEDPTIPIQIKLIDTESGRVIITTILNIQDKQTILVTDDLSKYQTLFLYGQKITDFNVLDKNAVFTIASAALQEVDRELQETKAKINNLKDRMNILKGNA